LCDHKKEPAEEVAVDKAVDEETVVEEEDNSRGKTVEQ